MVLTYQKSVDCLSLLLPSVNGLDGPGLVLSVVLHELLLVCLMDPGEVCCVFLTHALVVLVLLVRIFWLVLFTDKSRVLGEFSCQSEQDTFKFTLTFFPETEKFLHHLILHGSVL